MSPRTLCLLVGLIATGGWLIWPRDHHEEPRLERAGAAASTGEEVMGADGPRLYRPGEGEATDAFRRAGIRGASFITEDWSPENEAAAWRRKALGDAADQPVERPRHRLGAGEIDSVLPDAEAR